MSKVDRFADLIAWQKAHELMQRIYEVTRQGDFAKDFELKDQIQRAAVSIISTIAEGWTRPPEKGPPGIRMMQAVRKKCEK